MSIKVNFEIGHEASIRTKRTPEGFTHDWEVFVRGIETADISQFVEKVVFQLHETFPKPKRVVKEPPYCVKESGYAGFNLPIEIYLKNRDEPKKIRFNYDLHLQQSGPAIIKVQKEKYVFQNPSDEFRRKLFKGGGMVVTNPFSLHSNVDHERNSRDSFTDEKPQQLIGKPKLGGDSSKKHKSKEHRLEDLPRPTNSFVNLFGPPIHKTSRISPDPKKPSPNPKIEKKEKEKSHSEKDKQKIKHETKEKEYREEKLKPVKEDKERSKEEKRSKPHKERDVAKEKSSKRPAERPPSPAPPAKRPAPTPPPPSPTPKPNGSLPSKEDNKQIKYPELIDTKNKPPIKIQDNIPVKMEKKIKKDKKSHDKDRETKKEHKKEKEAKLMIPEIKEVKPKDMPIKEIPPPIKEKDKPVVKPEKPFNKLSLENFIKDPTETVKYPDGSKHKDKGDRERKHKHKKKDKKRDESREKNKESSSKEKKHKTEKHLIKEKLLAENKDPPSVPEKVDINTIPREIDKVAPVPKLFKEKDRSQLTISPISVDTSSQSSSKSVSKTSKSSTNPLSSMIEALSCTSNSESDVSVMSEDEDVSLTSENNSKSAKFTNKTPAETVKSDTNKSSVIPETSKIEKKPLLDKPEKNVQGSSHKSTKVKDKPNKHETKEEKKQRKRKSSSKGDDSENSTKTSKVGEETEQGSKSKRPENSSLPETVSRVKPEPSPRVKTDTKVQDDGVSSSLSDHPLKCDSPLSEDASQIDRKQISPDYMIQLKELQHRIMTIQSNEELERVVNLIAETGKYEVTKKTFDFDLCLLDRSTVQQLQELIGCESRA